MFQAICGGSEGVSKYHAYHYFLIEFDQDKLFAVFILEKIENDFVICDKSMCFGIAVVAKFHSFCYVIIHSLFRLLLVIKDPLSTMILCVLNEKQDIENLGQHILPLTLLTIYIAMRQG